MENPVQYSYVSTPAELARMLQHISSAPRAAIDTEADSLHHYFEKVCLIQLTFSGENYIVDPLAGVDLAPMFQWLAQKPLLLHGADYDLRMLKRDFGFQPCRIFDTMLAGQLLGFERFSLAALVERYFGITLCKQGQKADWSHRPLQQKLLDYAATDTHYLDQLADILEQELDTAGRLEWHREICAKLIESVRDEPESPHDDDDRYWRIKGWHSLKSRRAQAILRELWAWRDAEAQRADLPTYKILRGESMVELAKWADEHPDFDQMPKLPRNCVGRRMDTLRDSIKRGRKLPEEQWPRPLKTLQRGPQVNDEVFSRVRTIRDKYAKELSLDPGVLLPASSMSAVACHRPRSINDLQKSDALYDWQIKLLGEELVTAVAEGMEAGQKPKNQGRQQPQECAKGEKLPAAEKAE